MIAASIIAGGSAFQHEDFERLLSSLEGKVDGVFVAWNGAPQDMPTIKDGRFGEAVVEKFLWEDDFAKARNQAFAMIPTDRYDWIVWLDVDDTLEGDLRGMIADLKPTTQGVFLLYDYGQDDVSGVTLVKLWRERVLRADSTWQWKWTIHETCHGAPGTVYTRREDVYIKHHRDAKGDDYDSRRARNRRIITRARKENPDEPRYDYYMANELYAEAHTLDDVADRAEVVNAACELYRRFIMKTVWDDDAYTANSRMAELFRLVGDHNASLDAELQGIKVYPTWPNAYVGMAQSFIALTDWNKAKYWLDIAIERACEPVTAQVVEPLTAQYTPLVLRSMVNDHLGDLKAALNDADAAYQIRPNPALDESMMDLKDRIENPQKHAVPEPVKRRAPKAKSIAFVARPLFEPWHPLYEAEHGAGGAETCVMRLAPILAERGWDVFVFGTPGEHAGEHEGVTYADAMDWSPSEPFHVTVSSRAPEVFASPVKSKKKLLWVHDVNMGPEAFETEWGDVTSSIDTVIALTGWHARHLDHLYPGIGPKTTIIPNGIVPSRFPEWGNRAKDRFVWSSSPDRGLDILLGMWPSILEKWPNAYLKIFYGWESIDKICEVAPPAMANYLREFKEGVMWLFERTTNAEWVGRVPQSRLAVEMTQADYWAYPTYFMETFCITALEMQMAGVIPITTPLAGLTETVGPKAKKLQVPGWPNNVSFQKSFISRVDEVLSMPAAELDTIRKNGRNYAALYSWERIADRWEEALS